MLDFLKNQQILQKFRKFNEHLQNFAASNSSVKTKQNHEETSLSSIKKSSGIEFELVMKRNERTSSQSKAVEDSGTQCDVFQPDFVLVEMILENG